MIPTLPFQKAGMLRARFAIVFLLWGIFLGWEVGRYLVPFLWLPFLHASSFRDRLHLVAGVALVHILAFEGFIFHPAARAHALAFILMVLVGVMVGLLYTFYRVWPVLLFPLTTRHPVWRMAIWFGFALLTEWFMERFLSSIGVPVFFLTDVAGMMPLSWVSRVWGPWAGVWLGALVIWGALFVRAVEGQWALFVGMSGILISLVLQPPYAPVALRGHRLVFLSPGIFYRAPLEEYFVRYRDLIEALNRTIRDSDTLWLIFPENTFGPAPLTGSRQAKIQEFLEWTDRTVTAPHGRIWHTIVWTSGGLLSRVYIKSPQGDTSTYHKRLLFIGGEKYVPVITRFFGVRRTAGNAHDPGYRVMAPGWALHLQVCNEGLYPYLARLSPAGRGMILSPAQFSWLHVSVFLKAIEIRHRLVSNLTGLPLCTVQREGGMACYLPEKKGIRVIGNPWRQGAGVFAPPLLVGRFNPWMRYASIFFWLWLGIFGVGASLLNITDRSLWARGFPALHTGKGIRSRISSRI